MRVVLRFFGFLVSVGRKAFIGAAKEEGVFIRQD